MHLTDVSVISCVHTGRNEDRKQYLLHAYRGPDIFHGVCPLTSTIILYDIAICPFGKLDSQGQLTRPRLYILGVNNVLDQARITCFYFLYVTLLSFSYFIYQAFIHSVLKHP